MIQDLLCLVVEFPSPPSRDQVPIKQEDVRLLFHLNGPEQRALLGWSLVGVGEMTWDADRVLWIRRYHVGHSEERNLPNCSAIAGFRVTEILSRANLRQSRY